MKKSVYCILAAAMTTACVTGCRDDAAERIAAEASAFGYKGKDIGNYTSKSYIVTAPAVTNYVPERVLIVFEDYEYSAGEHKVLEDAKVVVPSTELAALPDGYAKDSIEPWFVYWTKQVQSFGYNGVAGVLSHYNEVSGRWETGESYFSTYWKSEEEAKKALADLRQKLAAQYGVSKFHDIAGGWVAEYVRLCLTGVVGQKADGQWSCMLNFRDKCKVGCGAWESVEDQQSRLNRYIYAKEIAAWRKKVNETLQNNHTVIMEKMKKESLAICKMQLPSPGLGQGMRFEYSIYNDFSVPSTNYTVAASNLWASFVTQLKGFCGAEIVGDVKNEIVGGDILFAAEATSPYHDLKLSVDARLLPMTASDEKTGADVVTTNTVGRWSMRLTEKLQEGITLPPQPVLKK